MTIIFRPAFPDWTPMKRFVFPLVLAVAFIVTLLVAQEPRQLVRPDPTPTVDRMVDSTSRVTCYLFRPTGAFTCSPWGSAQ